MGEQKHRKVREEGLRNPQAPRREGRLPAFEEAGRQAKQAFRGVG